MAAAEQEKQLYQHLCSESQVSKEATAAAGAHEKAKHVTMPWACTLHMQSCHVCGVRQLLAAGFTDNDSVLGTIT